MARTVLAPSLCTLACAIACTSTSPADADASDTNDPSLAASDGDDGRPNPTSESPATSSGGASSDSGAATDGAAPTTGGDDPPVPPSDCDVALPLAPTFHVAPTGDDDTGDGSEAAPWKTLAHGIAQLAPGDVLLVDDGEYAGPQNAIVDVPAGTDGFTTIAARHPLAVRIVGGSDLLFIGDRVHVDGFVFDAGDGDEFVGTIAGDHSRLTRSIFRRAGESGEQGGLLQLWGNDNLVEDVAGVGSCRACFVQGGPDASTQRNIWRRVVGRMDYTSSPLPKSTFNTYGNNADDSVRDHLYQNVIAIDGHAPQTGGEGKYGGFYIAKVGSNIRFQGVMVIGEAVDHAGIFGVEWGQGNVVDHAVVWGVSDGATGVRANTASHVTVGGFAGEPFLLDDGDAPQSVIDPTGPDVVSNTPGADLRTRWGISGTHWGEAGFDQPTDEPLWPWPCERRIAEVFAEPNDPPPGNSPAVNETSRGFAAGGTGLYGGPVTLTSYVWELLGTPCPDDVCGA